MIFFPSPDTPKLTPHLPLFSFIFALFAFILPFYLHFPYIAFPPFLHIYHSFSSLPFHIVPPNTIANIHLLLREKYFTIFTPYSHPCIIPNP
jgi:hypothetical protein